MARKLIVEIIGDASSLERSFARAQKSTGRFNRELSQSSRGAIAGSLAFKGLGRSVAFASLPFLGGAGLVAGLKAASSAASDVAEQTAKAEVVFGSASATVQAFAKDALGLSNREALQVTATFGALLRPLGFLEQQSADTSIELAKLGVDLASFSNTSVTDALDAIRSGLVGETEPLRRYAVRLSEVRVQQEAMAATGKKSAKALTEQEKVTARLAIIYRDTAQAQGDYARTSGSLANQQRTLQSNFADLAAEIGEVLNPAILTATENLNKWLEDPENKERVIDGFETSVHVLGVAFRFAADGAKLLKEAWDKLPDFGKDKGLIETLRGGGTREEAEKLFGMKFPGGAPPGVAGPLTPELKAIIAAVAPPGLKGPLTAGAGGAGAAVGAQRKGVTQTQRNRWFDDMIGRALDRVQDVKTLQGQVGALGKIAGLVRERLAITKDITRQNRLEDELLDISRQQKSLTDQIAANKIEARRLGLEKEQERLARERAAVAARIAANKSKQFRALGLTGSGDEIVAGERLLKKQLGRVEDAVKGTFLDTKKTRSVFAGIRKAMGDGLKDTSRDVRQAIKQILDDFDKQIKDRKGQDTTFRHVATQNLFKGLGLTPEQLRATRTQVATIGANGLGASSTGQFASQRGGGVTITGPVHVHGVQDMRAFENEIERRARSRPHVRRGAR